MTLTEARELFAATLSTVPGMVVSPRPQRGQKQGTGWVLVARLEPGARFSSTAVTLTAILVLGADETAAEESLDGMAVQAVTALNTLPCSDIAAEPQSLLVGAASAPLYVLAVTATVEVP
jgi:hypothetical protein